MRRILVMLASVAVLAAVAVPAALGGHGGPGGAKPSCVGHFASEYNPETYSFSWSEKVTEYAGPGFGFGTVKPDATNHSADCGELWR